MLDSFDKQCEELKSRICSIDTYHKCKCVLTCHVLLLEPGKENPQQMFLGPIHTYVYQVQAKLLVIQLHTLTYL